MSIFPSVSEAVRTIIPRLPRILVALAASALFSAPIVASTQDLELLPCTLEAAEGRFEVRAQCGQIALPVDSSSDTDRLLDIHVAVLPALSENPAPDPLVILSGGPGQGASRLVAGSSASFERVRRTRDLIVIDQRGTGRSNPLDCPEPENPQAAFQFNAETTATVVRACFAELSDQPLSAFTTRHYVDDLDAVRSKLGYTQWNLYGVSYGTRVALEYLRKFPQFTRRVVLDGVLPPEIALGTGVAHQAQRSWERLQQRCSRDSACAERFPDLQARLDELLEALPIEMALRHPRTGVPFDLTLTAEHVVATLRLLLYTPESMALVPLAIDQAAGGEPDLLGALIAQAFASMAEEIAEGLNFSVVCAEDYPRYPQALDSADATFLGTLQFDAIRAACEIWPAGEVPPEVHTPVVADHPVLLLSGSDDPITPPAYGDAVAEHLPNSQHLVLNGMGHGMLRAPCVPRLIAEFLDHEGAAEVDASCLQPVTPFPVFTSPLGPAP